MDRIDRIFERVLKDIKPDKFERDALAAHTNELVSRLKNAVPKDVEIVVVGSIAHDTNLKGDSDVDIFLLFNGGQNKAEITRRGMAYAKSIINKKHNERYEVKYAEHPYVRVYLDNYDIKADIVPAMKISSIDEMVTSVDRSPLHVEFVNSKLTSKQKDDVRLLKYLLKAHDIYGAEIKIKGFSGYLCELLVYSFGSLKKLLEAATAFKLPLYINPANPKEKANDKIVKKFNSSFIVIDPVDPDRNVAAGVSIESLSKFVLVARAFIKEPSIEAFYGRGIDATRARTVLDKFVNDSGLGLYLITMPLPDKSEDILWPQLRKVSLEISNYAAKFGFEVYVSSEWIAKNRGFMMFAAPRHRLKSRLVKGPEVLRGNFTDSFIASHKNALGIILRGAQVYALEKNSYSNIDEIFRAAASGKIIKRHKDINMGKAKLFVDRMPKEYAESVLARLVEKTSI